MLENTVARGRAFSDTAARGRVFSEDSADIPFLTASIVDGERRGGFAVMLGASIDEGDGDEDDDSRASEDDESPTQQLMYRPRLGMVVLPSIVFFMSIFILIPRSFQSFARSGHSQIDDGARTRWICAAKSTSGFGHVCR